MAKRSRPRADIARRTVGAGEVLSTSARIFLKHFGVIALLGFGVYLPIELLMVQVAESAPTGNVGFELMAVEGVFELLLGTMVALFVVRLTANAVNGESTTFGAVWSAAKGRYFSAVATTIAAEMVLLGLLVLLVIPALAGVVYIFFFLPVVALREETGFHALKHSKRLVEGRFWQVAGYAGVIFLLGQGTPFVDQLAPSRWIGAPIGAAVSVLSLYMVVVTTVLYLHLERTRFEDEA